LEPHRGSFPDTLCLHEMVEAQADRTPHALAVSFGDGNLTYAQLEERANRLARHLRGLGVGPESRVGICTRRSPETIVAMLGVLKAGGAYVPIDPAAPAERIAYVLDDARVSVLLTQAALLDDLPRHAATPVLLDTGWGRIAREDAARLPLRTTPRNLAYILYTSGSTGRPKGVQVEHRGVCNLITAQQRTFGAMKASGCSASRPCTSTRRWPRSSSRSPPAARCT
jgi:non-ribosomal peptide synthetase component F